MEHFFIRLAGIAIGVQCQYYSTKEYCSEYLTDTEPLFSVSVSETEIEAEQRFFAEKRSPAYLETLALYRKIAEGLLDYDVLLLHGSAIAVDGEVYIFIAPSGTGKSTHTALWRTLLKPPEHEVCMVNDDKPLIRVTREQILACGTPWTGAHRLGENVMLPVKAICILERAKQNTIEEITADQAFSFLFRQTYHPDNAEQLARVLCLLGEIKSRVRFYCLRCTVSEEAVKTAYNRMKSGETNEAKERNVDAFHG